MERKNTIILSIISILTLLVMAFGATYAFLAASVDEEDQTRVSATTNAKIPSFMVLGEKPLSIDVTYEKMWSEKANDEITGEDLTSSSISTFVLQSGASNKITNCNFDIVFEWDSDSSIYDKTLDTTKEFTIEGKLINYENIMDVDDSKSLVEYINDINNLPETNLDEFTWKERDGKKYAVLLNNVSISSISQTTPTKINYEFTLRFYNTTKNQNDLLDKKFKGGIKVYTDMLSCEVE